MCAFPNGVMACGCCKDVAVVAEMLRLLQKCCDCCRDPAVVPELSLWQRCPISLKKRPINMKRAYRDQWIWKKRQMDMGKAYENEKPMKMKSL